MNARVQTTANILDRKRGFTTSKVQKPEFSPSTSSPIDQILRLQRTIGNRAVQRLIKSGALQANLKISQFSSMYGQEANRVAQQVMCAPQEVPLGWMPERIPLRGTQRLMIQRAPGPCISILSKLKTEKVNNAPRKYYGASFNHTFFPYLPQGCSITGFQVSEAVSTQRDDFRTGVKNVPLGKYIWTLTQQNKLDKPDDIFTPAGPKGLGANPLRKFPAVLDQNQKWYYRRSPKHSWQLGPGIVIKVTLDGDLKNRRSLKVTTTDHGVSRTESYRGPKIRISKNL